MWRLRDREVASSSSDRHGLNVESCVWRAVTSFSSHHPQEVIPVVVVVVVVVEVVVDNFKAARTTTQRRSRSRTSQWVV